MMTVPAQGLAVPPRPPVLRNPREYGMDYEDIPLKTADGITLSA